MFCSWAGEGLHEQGIEQDTGLVRVVVDRQLYRPAEVPHLQGSAEKARKELGWTPETSFEVSSATILHAEHS